MSQIIKCEFAHKRGAKKITHIVFINPDLSRDRDFFMPPCWEKSVQSKTCDYTIKNRGIPVNGCVPEEKVTPSESYRCMDNPKVHPISVYYTLSKENRFLNQKWRFGGGISPPDKSSTECTPHFLRGFFFGFSRPNNLPQPSFPLSTHRNN